MVVEVDVKGLIIKDGGWIDVDLMVWVVGVKVLDFIIKFVFFEMNRVN